MRSTELIEILVGGEIERIRMKRSRGKGRCGLCDRFGGLFGRGDRIIILDTE